MRWSNIPVPEPHVAAIVGAAAFHFVLPLRIPLARRTRLALAGPMLASGIGLGGLGGRFPQAMPMSRASPPWSQTAPTR